MNPEQQAKLDEEMVKFALRGNLDGVREAAVQGANAGYKYGLALSVAAQEGHDAVVSLLIAHGADIHAQQDEALRSAVNAGRKSTVTLLLREGANANALEGQPLISAATRGDANMVRDLLAHKADPHYSEGQALRMAAYEGHADVVRVLLKFRADPFDMRGSAAVLAHSGKHEETFEMLAEAMNDQRGAFLFDLSLQEKTQNWLRAPYSDTGDSAFIRAVKMNALDAVVEKMKQSGDSVSYADMHGMKDRHGHSLAVLAAESGQLKKLFDCALWKGDVEGLQATWSHLPAGTQHHSGLSTEDVETIVRDYRQRVLKEKSGRYKLKGPGLIS